MSSKPDYQPASELGESLLTAARKEEPSEAATQRALALVDAEKGPAGTAAGSRSWLRWAIPAAALVAGLAIVVIMRPAAAPESVVAEPLPSPLTTGVAGPVAPAPSSVAIAAPSTTTSAASSALAAASSSPSSTPEKVAAGPRQASPPSAPAPAGKPKATPPRPPTGGCPPNDLMCNMRQGQKKKKAKKKK